ncbi:MAG: alpha/beta hydrolase [Gordonia sp. (in: high G+C Gram-positive bacteria)]|uniref:alpha/beta hydrolase n=1 Tax=Gordonia sp. (in: high G+C Gram-positive bacteria) TaxID=84139 RepID=UPI003C753C51
MRLDLHSLIDPALLPLVEESRAFYADRTPGRGPTTLDELHAARAGKVAPGICWPEPSIETVNAGGTTVDVRIHLPTEVPPAGVVLEMHAGGFYLGSAAGSDTRNRQLADRLGVAVVSVDYRLAPEHPWPSAPDDCETAALWLVENAEARFGTTRLAMLGLSAGSTLVATTLIRLRERGINNYCGAVLDCGTYDLSGQTPAGRLIADEYFLQAYLGDCADRTIADVSPIYADLRGLPPVRLVVGADDILLDDNLAMVGRLMTAGVEVDLNVYPESPHAFTAHPTSMAAKARSGMYDWLRIRIEA